ncbi:hypothetical protein [Streptomyces sp. SM12]|uniref:hypothetical protein n=1 Tax=Streptomyces sp. SM12 TaxID=1071602 RepID=UPI000CD5AC41|nr:hypothetical protein [Streptomyces sp. SM12]
MEINREVETRVKATVTLDADEVSHLVAVLHCQVDNGDFRHDKFARTLLDSLSEPAEKKGDAYGPLPVGTRVREICTADAGVIVRVDDDAELWPYLVRWDTGRTNWKSRTDIERA